MREFFYPNSVAVIGVSSNPDNLGRNIVANLIGYGFSGIVYAVGVRGGVIETRRIYRAVGDIPDHIDLAVIFTPAHTVPGILEECGQKGVRWAIIETAGFREYTDRGREIEAEISQVARRYGIRFVGPNCIGIINMENGFCVPFPRLKKIVKQGEVSIVTQSGGVGMSALNLLANEGIGMNKFVSIGNILDVTAEDMIEYLIEDSGTSLIFVYLEGIHDGRRLMQLGRKSTKPILVFKSNIGKLGQSIALSHTASLTSDDKVVDAALHQAGILRIRDATTLGNSLKILRLPAMRGRRLAIISRSGGHAVMAADACDLSGFDLAYFPDEFLREIENHFRASVIRLTNPLDLGDLFDLDVYANIVERTLQLEGVDGIIMLHTSLSEAEDEISRALLERIIDLVHQYKKPVAYYISASAQEVTYLKQTYDFPIFTQVVETVRALEMSHYRFNRSEIVRARAEVHRFDVDQSRVADLLAGAQREGRNLLLSEALEVLRCYGLPAADSRMVQSSEQAVQAARELGYPVVLKVVADAISHKSDAGGVALNLPDGQSLESAYLQMVERIQLYDAQAKLDGFLVQPMIAGGREMILGGRQDSQFGPVVLIGMGGIFVEVLEDVVVRVAPITEIGAHEMLESLGSRQILKGVRGQPPADTGAMVDALLRLSQLLCDFPEIKEIDINPMSVFNEGEGCLALDARIIIQN